MLTLWNINDDDDNVVVLVIPREPASLGCHVADATRSRSPVGSSVVLGTWACLSRPTCGGWSSFGAWLSLSSLLGVRSHPFGARLLGAGHRLPVVVLFASGYRVVGWAASFWAAGVIRGGVARVTWHAGDMEGARSPGYVGVWLSGLVGRLSWFVGGVGCCSWWRLLVGGVVAWRSGGG